jgi:DNA-binding NarL/FixJ family response regulator
LCELRSGSFGRGVKTAVVVENLLRREGLRRLLARTSEFEIVELAPSEPDLLVALDELRPQVVVADSVSSRPGRGGVGFAVEIGRRGTAGVVLVGEHADAAEARALLELGVGGRGYVVEGRLRSSAELIGAIRKVARGGTAIDVVLAEELAAERRRQKASPLSWLTPREHEVLSEIAAGWSNAAIARSFAISKRAVERHIASIFRKCALSIDGGESRRVAVTLLYLRSNLACAEAAKPQDDARALRAEPRRHVRRRELPPTGIASS